MFDQVDQFLCCKPTDRLCVLTECCKPGFEDAGKSQSVISCDGDVIRYPESSFVDLVDPAQGSKIIRVKDAGRRIFQIEEFGA